MKPPEPNEPETARELRLAKEYWLSRIRPHIAGRSLTGVELYVAEDAHRRLVEARGGVDKLNNSRGGQVVTDLLADLDGESFQAPEPSYADENLKPELLATIAAPMIKERNAKLTPNDAVRAAHELLMAAERYVMALPQRKQGTESLLSDFDESHFVTFVEIRQSNETASCRLPLLPPEPPTRSNGQLKLSAIKAAVKDFLESRTPRLAQEQFEQRQMQIESDRKEGKICFLGESGRPLTWQAWQKQNTDEMTKERIWWPYLCALRWERYKKFCDQQQTRARNRSPSESEKPPTKKSGKAKASLVTSAAASPQTAGKREK